MFMRHQTTSLHDDRGQDLIEYTLLIAFIVLATTALLIATGRDVGNIWAGGNQVLSSARNAAAGNPPGNPGGNPGFGSGGNPGAPGNPGNNPNPGRGK